MGVGKLIAFVQATMLAALQFLGEIKKRIK
jgi:hypothetical protein